MANSQISFIKFYNNQKYIFMKQNHIRLVKYYKYLFIQEIKKIYSFYLFLPSSSLFSLSNQYLNYFSNNIFFPTYYFLLYIFPNSYYLYLTIIIFGHN